MSDFISPSLKLQKESSKRIFLLGDFNIQLIHLVVTFYCLIYSYLQESLKPLRELITSSQTQPL